MMLHTKYQCSRPYGFRQEDFFMFFHVKAYVQGSHKLWKSWKAWKITKKNSMHEKIMEFEKKLNHGIL